MRQLKPLPLVVLFVACSTTFAAPIAQTGAAPYNLRDHYSKLEYDIPMRDGVKLRVEVFVPKDIPGKHPILMERTPYSAGPYGPGGYKGIRGSQKFKDAGYIFAYADVRGQYMSEGTFMKVRPELKPGQAGIDESTDTYDTVDFLVKHVPDNNGAVGMWGISYPGFYAGVGAINTHPALKAVSPQAPVSDWFLGDDVHHNGAFFIQDTFDFALFFDTPRTGPEPRHQTFQLNRQGMSAYDFFLDAGTSDGLDKKYLNGRIPYWNELNNHPNYDSYWKDRSLPRHFKNVSCAVLTVGGWFDAEDQWGALNLFRAGEKLNRHSPNYLVMGPWFHGMWAGGTGRTFGDLDYGANTSEWYRENVEFPFFEKYLRGQIVPAPAKATVFETGVNKWHTLDVWPPKGLAKKTEYLGPQGTLVDHPVQAPEASDSYMADPGHPTPYLADYAHSGRRTREYMVDDQRFAESRPDVLTYKGPTLDQNTTFAGPTDVDLWVSSTGTDGDFVVKIIDVWPSDSQITSPRNVSMAGYEQLVKGDIFRGRFRNSFEKPEPFVPGRPTHVHFKMNDMYHTFMKGHRMMVQVQSYWFPLVDRNPNKFVDIYHAQAQDFQIAQVSVLRDAKHASSLTFGEIKAD